MSLALTLGRLRFAGLEAGKADVALTLNAGVLAIDRFSIGDLGGAALDARGRVDLQKRAARRHRFRSFAARRGSLAQLVERFAPTWSDALQRSVRAAIPAKLQGKLDIEPAAGGASRFVFAASGPLGAGKLELTASLTGNWNNAARGRRLAAGEPRRSRREFADGLVSADRIAPVARQPGRYTLSLDGKPEGEMRIDTRLASANIDLRAAGTVRSLSTDERSGALDIAIGPSRGDAAAPDLAGRACGWRAGRAEERAEIRSGRDFASTICRRGSAAPM